jgi:hypothetical protein
MFFCAICRFNLSATSGSRVIVVLIIASYLI